MKKQNKTNKGFTLVELMASILIFSFIAGAIYAAFIAGNVTWERYGGSIATQREARQALVRMSAELREASNISITQSAESAQINFLRSGVGSISYTWNSTGNDANKILRTFQSTTTIIANDISSLSFTDHTNAITINLTASRANAKGQLSTFQLKEKIALR